MYRAHLAKLARTPLDDVLMDEGVVDRATLEAAQAEQAQTGRPISDILIESEIVEEWDLAKIVSGHYGLPFIDLKSYSIPGPILEFLPLDWCRQRLVLPVDQFGPTMAVACVEVPQEPILRELAERTGCAPFLYVVTRRALRDVIDETVKRRGGRTAPASSITGRGVTKARAADAEAAPEDDDVELAPLDLPQVSFRLDASAAHAGVAVAAPAASRRARAEQLVRPAESAAAPAPKAPAPAARPPVPAPARPAPVVPAAAPAPAPRGGGGDRSGARTGWESIFDSGDAAVKRKSKR